MAEMVSTLCLALAPVSTLMRFIYAGIDRLSLSPPEGKCNNVRKLLIPITVDSHRRVHFTRGCKIRKPMLGAAFIFHIVQ